MCEVWICIPESMGISKEYYIESCQLIAIHRDVSNTGYATIYDKSRYYMQRALTTSNDFVQKSS